MTATPFLVVGVQWLFNHLSPLPSDLSRASVLEAPWWLWALAFLCCFSIAQILAWCDEHRQRQELEETHRDFRERSRSDIALRDAQIKTGAELRNAVVLLSANADSGAGMPIGATLRVPLPNGGDVLIGNIRRINGYLIAKVMVRIKSAFTETTTVQIRLNGATTNTTVLIQPGTSGTFWDAGSSEVIPLPEHQDLVEIQGVALVGSTEYTSDKFPLVI
jgi:hypothetical protein